MTLPAVITRTNLFARLNGEEELRDALRSMREVVEVLAATTGRTVPSYTDHTIRHMDALWGVADVILTENEIERLNEAEAFLLGASFYLHDIGMAYAATAEGVERLKRTPAFISFMAGVELSKRNDLETIANAIALAVRITHADAAMEIALTEVPGTADIFVFPNKMFRDAWGATCGEIAASHHWPTAKLEAKFGRQRDAPLPGNRKADLLYVACCLRLIDFAHINRERASSLERAFRYPLGAESLTHWLAQENIDGPTRDSSDFLVYRAARPISHVDSWWLYYEMISGLNDEINSVTRLLDQSASQYKRLSIKGVRGALSPSDASNYIPTSGFLPIEVNLRTGSIEKLVELLAGETLYGPNPMAAIRELIQNSRDAVMLKNDTATSPIDRASLSLPIRVSLTTTTQGAELEVIDYGIGMTKLIMTDYLISIASNYWASQFSRDFPDLAVKGFKNAGKFGIGFLSVFMLGDEVTVESNRAGEDRYRLTLRGVGRRGEIQMLRSPSGSGTSVRVKVNAPTLVKIAKLDELVPLYAPTLPHALNINVDGRDILINDGWINRIPPSELLSWSQNAEIALANRGRMRIGRDYEMFWFAHASRFGRRLYDSDSKDSNEWGAKWPEYISGRTRLIASRRGAIILSLRGLSIQSILGRGLAGVIELESASTDVSRSIALDADVEPTLKAARDFIAPQIAESLHEVCHGKAVIDHIELITKCVELYGNNAIIGSPLQWINKISMPGNLQLISYSELVASLSRINSVFVAFGLGPWTTIRKWSASQGLRDDNEFAVALDSEGQGTPEYSRYSEEEIGSIEELWPKWKNSVLFSVLVDAIAQSWQLSPTELVKREGWGRVNNTIYGRFLRK